MCLLRPVRSCVFAPSVIHVTSSRNCHNSVVVRTTSPVALSLIMRTFLRDVLTTHSMSTRQEGISRMIQRTQIRPGSHARRVYSRVRSSSLSCSLPPCQHRVEFQHVPGRPIVCNRENPSRLETQLAINTQRMDVIGRAFVERNH